VGYRLYDVRDSDSELPIAVEVALPDPDQQLR
jgi:hypothetical protein